MPIADLSNVRRIPRLGKIRLGVKVEEEGKHSYPRPTDYFVVPPEVAAVYGPEPRELSILFPLDDIDQFAPQWLRCYSLTQGLVCIGDGRVSRRKVDKATGAMASHETLEWVWKEGLSCRIPEECPEYERKRCRAVMNLMFLLPDVPGLGVYQIDTSSSNSIKNINNTVRMLVDGLGRCRMIPLKLTLEPQEVEPPGIKKKTVHTLHLRTELTLPQLAEMAALPVTRALLPPPDAVDDIPEDLYPPDVLEETPEEGPVELPHQREDMWKAIIYIISAGPCPGPRQVSSWWEGKGWGYALALSDFKQGAPLHDIIKLNHLEQFRDALLAFQSKVNESRPKGSVNLQPEDATPE